ncbi:ThuA domain-containing protein, partial [candidate division KSB1 bacterium]|nr:ThuA domain-containing protein [candidate division KSB1 bacterium]
MRRSLHQRILALAIICLFALNAKPSHTQIPADDLAKIEAALPTQGAATPQHPRKLLVFTLTEGYKHASIPYAAKALELMGQKTGAFAATISDNMASFAENQLKQFDAVCFVSTTELKFADPKLRESLMKFVKGGKGVIGIHAASDNFYNWPEAAEMMGGLFDGHPWTSNGTWAVKIDDAIHPLTAAFRGEGFSLSDEIYRFKAPISREHLRVLMSLDLANEGNLKVEGLRTTDLDIPISWIRNFGKGCVFYCSLGHNNEVYWNAAVLQHYLDGIQFALGDLQADTTPSVATCLTAIAKYEYGQSRARLTELDNFIRVSRSSPEALQRLEQNFLKILSSANATLAGKQYVCEHLSTLGTSASVPALAKMLNNPETVEMARFALERIPHEAALEALRRALPQAKGKAQAGIITSLGQRRDAKSVALLAGLIKSADTMIAYATVAALGAIADEDAAEALRSAKQEARGEFLSRILAAQLQCAEAFAARGAKAQAMQIYIESNVSNIPAAIRFAAVRGQILTEPENAAGRILQFLESNDPVLQVAAPRLVGEVPSSQSLDAIVNALPKLSALQQVQLLAALAQRREASVLVAASQATKSAHAEVRLAALQALAHVGDTASVRLLAETAMQRNEEGKAARESLNRLRGNDIDAVIASNVPAAEPKLKIELLRAIEARRIFPAAPVALQAARANEENVRVAAIQALKTVGGPEHLHALIEGLLQTKSEEERSELEKTVAAVAQRISEPEQRNAAILAAMPHATNLEAKASLLHVLGKVGEASALPTLGATLQDAKPELRAAAIRALSDWPNDAPREDLLKIAQTSRNQTEKILALRGFVHLVGLDSSRASAQTLELYQTAMQLAPDLDTKRAVLSGLAKQQEVAALEMAAKYLGDVNL